MKIDHIHDFIHRFQPDGMNTEQKQICVLITYRQSPKDI